MLTNRTFSNLFSPAVERFPANRRCGVADPKRRAWCFLPVGHPGKHQDSWGKKFSARANGGSVAERS